MTFLTRFPSYIDVSRRLRFIPEGGALVEVTCRTIQGRFLLKPTPMLNELVVGALGRAQELYPVEICGLIFTSNHYHMLLRVPDAERLSRFMGHVNSNIAREAGKLAQWREKFWSRRYQHIVVTEEEPAQIDRRRYLLSNGAKEGLVKRPQDWPGVHGIRSLLEGEPLRGYWFDRTKEYAARNRKEEFSRLEYATEQTVHLSPLPCWSHLSPEQIRGRLVSLLEEIESEAAARQARTGIEPLGPQAIAAQHPHSSPARLKKSPAPLCHAATKGARKEFEEAYGWFYAAFRDAADKLKAGIRDVCFPIGSFPPGLPFVGGSPPPLRP